jgi:hypothetical protein
VGGKWQLATTITDQQDASRNCAFKDIQNGGLTVPQLLKELAVFPADGSGYNTESFYLNNGAGLERFPYRGGYWLITSYAGVFCANLANPRSSSYPSFGFRSAFYGA